MFSFMLDLNFNNLCLMFSFIGLEQGKSIVQEQDKKTLYPMLLKCHHHMHPLFEDTTID